MTTGAASFRGFWARAEGAPPRVVGHRGAKGDAPENTLGAFTRGVDLGATAVELDVRTCASGELVVAHDPTLERITSGRDARRVADLPWSELARVRLAAGERVPLLREVLALLAARSIGVNVEMKHDVPDRAAVVLATAQVLAGATQPIVVSSFDPRMLLALAGVAPELPRAQLVHRSRYHLAMLAAVGSAERAALRPLRVHAVHLERTLTTPARVRALHDRGLCVSVWTVNDPAEAERLREMGVDSLITDVPGELAAAVAPERSRSSVRHLAAR